MGTFIIIVILGYLLGSVNSAIVVGKLYGTDIRKHGSGNAGMTNTLRTLGKSAAIMVTLGDVLKGVIACLIGYFSAGEPGLLAGGAACILGHNWPLYFGFRGGKGALTSITVIFLTDYRIGFIILGMFIIAVAVTRFVSLGSIIGAAALPVMAILFDKSVEFIIFSVFLGLLVIGRHHSNISRLIKGNESKLGKKKTDAQ